MKTLTIIGAGGWGTALSIALSRNVEHIGLWVYEPDLCQTISITRVNPFYLPDFLIPANVHPTTDLETALCGSEAVLIAVPSDHLRGVLQQMRTWANPEQIFISATKGLETGT